MDAKHWTGAPGECATDPECDQRKGIDPVPVELCCYCGRSIGMGAVTVANVGQWCSRDCRNAHAARDYAAKVRRTA